MHAINAELIWILVCAVLLVCFWRVVLALFLCAVIGTTMLGLVTVLSYLGH
jgi:uncharacterized MnhB-related membrane protein